MGNRFFSLEPDRGETPRRVFAMFDHRTDNRIYLDAIDASQAIEFGFGGGLEYWHEWPDRTRLFVIELPIEFGQRFLSCLTGSDEDDRWPRLWLDIRIRPDQGVARIYHGLFAGPDPIGIESVRFARPAYAKHLNRMVDLAPYVASPKEIEDALELQDPIRWIGVYDVGQGSANGICDADSVPLAYFDLGGGVLANTKTFPSAFQNICTGRHPPVVLSHWDWDHWSSAARFPQSQQLTWIVPNQKLGAVHGAMAAAIVRQGKLLVWPRNLWRVRTGQIRIEKCTGKSGRNNTGLAMLIDGPNGELPILLTGDARYSAIPSGFTNVFSIVASHHGADMKSKATPGNWHNPASRIAYSYGPGNTFAHPRDCTYTRHHANGWQHRNIQPAGAIDRHTPDRRPDLGNIGLGWSNRPLPLHRCGGWNCSLQLEQG